MSYLPPAPKDLNASVCKEMVKNGAPDYIYAKYFHDVAIAAMKSDFDLFHTPPEMKMTRAHKLAARLVYEFLKRTNLSLTLESAETEAENEIFSANNKISKGCLQISKVRPPIQKLIRQRYVDLGNGEEDVSEGWFEIDSEVLHTISQSEDEDPTYVLPENLEEGQEDDHRSYKHVKERQIKLHNEFSETVSASIDNYELPKKSTHSQYKASAMAQNNKDDSASDIFVQNTNSSTKKSRHKSSTANSEINTGSSRASTSKSKRSTHKK
ncbi:hypothetical protein TVAG_436660 [Trichomonas vaginalis G3]|uniref:LisH domain-containing protein n=1 Tax=Trichomonas vaginalis (strain ATCC PRA-98 / G3) TaxID=412133 RepID=A2DFB4_TRIV3|nr:hypothetical protein TVAGG3_0565560 [Trichomonas vaginalis G3]EAY20842.1 hypothetical protein TVAG_436660 [Trichomonas vaginalis G3]KAI5521547.1 hypothetical protein TVAGG3_0565560 [Trichomonas vaginalis G3]|eukprot:XP_001581828.1 hypothetical protein [Trichomonas vaginalis G3]